MKAERISVKIPYRHKEIAKAAGFRWNPSTKEWRGYLSVMACVILRDYVEPSMQAKMDSFMQSFSKTVQIVSPILDAAPMNHQNEVAGRAKAVRRFGIFHDMGTGKTLSTIMIMQDLWSEQAVSRIVVVCPLAVMIEWESQISRFASVPVKTVRIGGLTPKKRKEAIRLFTKKKDCLMVAIVNYESLRKIENDLAMIRPEMAVFDESTRIKNRNAQQTKAAKKLSDQVEYAFALTGTPISNNVTELYSQLRCISPSCVGNNYWAFAKRYAEFGGFEGRQVMGMQNEKELKRILSHVSHTVRKEDVLDLPPKTYVRHEAVMTGEQLAAYAKAEKDFLIAIKAVRESDTNESNHLILIKNALVRMTFCQRIASGHVKEDLFKETVRFRNNAKADVLQAVVKDAGSAQIVVCARFREDLKIIQEIIEPMRSVVPFHGGLSNERADSNLTAFKEEKADALVMQVQKGGYGLNLANAPIIVFWNNWFSYGVRDQAEARIHRKGQEKNCLFVDLVAKSSVDELILQAIRNKQDISEALFGARNEKSYKINSDDLDLWMATEV